MSLTAGLSSKSEGTVFRQRNDADFWGLSAYAAKGFQGLSVKADLGCLSSKNDLKGAYARETVDARAWTLGLRFTRIDVDDLADRENGSVNLIEAPVGVALKASFDAAGWRAVPRLDLSVAPQLGDKDASTRIGGVSVDANVIDHALGRAALGVEATKGDFTFGFGSEDRANHALKASARCAF